MTIPTNLTDRIRELRSTTTDRGHGPVIAGVPFVCQFVDRVDPDTLVDAVNTIQRPWQWRGIKTPLRGEWWLLAGSLIHSDDGTHEKLTLECSPEELVIYIRNETTPDRIAAFVEAVNETAPLADVSFEATPPRP